MLNFTIPNFLHILNLGLDRDSDPSWVLIQQQAGSGSGLCQIPGSGSGSGSGRGLQQLSRTGDKHRPLLLKQRKAGPSGLSPLRDVVFNECTIRDAAFLVLGVQIRKVLAP
jgi:hypothetical protein